MVKSMGEREIEQATRTMAWVVGIAVASGWAIWSYFALFADKMVP